MPIAFTTVAPTAVTPARPDGPLHVRGLRSDRLADDAVGIDPAMLGAQGFEATAGQTQFATGADGELVLAVGLGPAADVGPAVVRRAAAMAARAARLHAHLVVDLLGRSPDGGDERGSAQALVEGVVLGSYRYDALRSSPRSPVAIESVVVVGRGGKRLQVAVERGQVVAGAVSFARDLVNEPGGSLTPSVFAERAQSVAAEAGLRITVLDEEGVATEQLGGLLGVNRGSSQPPRFVELAWDPDRPRGSVALVGKGITFDAGGLSIKTADGMSTMKDDMGGAAAVLAAMSAVPLLAPRLRVTAYLPLTDNMLGPDATRPGDVLTIRGGTTVEVLNTDAEGRLILADALVKASESGPDAIIDVATLTGACEVALGRRTAGVMGFHDGLVAMVEEAGGSAGEDVWRLPMRSHFRRQLDSDVADLRNVGAGRFGGAMIAAAFLAEFVPDGTPWAHLDIAGTAFSRDDDAELAKGGTGFGVRLLLQLLATWRRPR